MSDIFLSSFTGVDDCARFAAALDFMREHPGTTLFVEPGVYNITSERARAAQSAVMNGEYGANPEPIMFNPKYAYDRGLDFAGHKNSTVEAYGAILLVDGFMEDISIRDCEGVTIRGFTIDVKRKPYSKGVAIGFYKDGEITRATLSFADEITDKMPIPRSIIYSHDFGRFIPDVCNFFDFKFVDPHTATCAVTAPDKVREGDEFYIWHTFHSRPAILIEEARNTLIEDVTIHAHPGMGITAQHATNVTVNRLRVVPSVGEHMSTNTDATHFASCRGLVRFDGCEFDGQGDDSINVHTYYYSVVEHSGREATLEVRAPTGTHAQSLDYPQVGDRLELTEICSCLPLDTYRVTGVTLDREAYNCRVTLDRELPDDLDGLFFADPDELPHVEFVNCTARNHFARSILIKSRTALIENCTVNDVFELGVKVAAEGGWHEGINSESITIRRCRFINCGRLAKGCGGIGVYMDTPVKKKAHGTVVIEDNIIDCPKCEHGIIVDNTRKAIIRRNSIVCAGDKIKVGEDVDLVTE